MCTEYVLAVRTWGLIEETRGVKASRVSYLDMLGVRKGRGGVEGVHSGNEKKKRSGCGVSPGPGWQHFGMGT